VWQSNHQKTPFTTKKEISAGGNSKNKAKGFSGGASAGLPVQALGLSLHGSVAITLEVGSRFFVDGSHENSRTLCPAFFMTSAGWDSNDIHNKYTACTK